MYLPISVGLSINGYRFYVLFRAFVSNNLYIFYAYKIFL